MGSCCLLEVLEIIRRSEQGVTNPFVCRADDEQIYFVKGRNLTRRGLVVEFVSAELAVRFGLPVPPHALLEVSRELISNAAQSVVSDLGAGIAFGSLAVEGSDEISLRDAARLEENLRRDIAVFDWWIGNGDRTLTEHGGNPNLLTELASGAAVVIDHNLAFDFGCDIEGMAGTHIFRDQLLAAAADRVVRQEYERRFSQILTDWSTIEAAVPYQWHYQDNRFDDPVDVGLDEMKTWLERAIGAGEWV